MSEVLLEAPPPGDGSQQPAATAPSAAHVARGVTHRRGNWITLKMRKLIKPKSQRERMRTLALTPSRSECGGDGFLPLDSQDSSSIGSGSNSLDDMLATAHHRRSSTLKRLPFMRNRSKDKDKAKAVYRRSMCKTLR
ncbi:Girdin [Merluccius polli]|uniref:Girdin n=1 Tax=Merluccius polli TaxID=89951 RepID=A0AA47N0B6_MERPO|nr:Girdin [Merluccius polli]